MNDIDTFGLHCSRIPTQLFKLIVQEIDVMMVQHGPLIEHHIKEVRSQFLSPVSASHFPNYQQTETFNLEIFNHLLGIFGFAFRNLPESIIKGHITTKGRVEYCFTMIGPIAVLVMEVKIGSGKEHLNAIAQVIAECNG
jgi:hypothetical protein